MAPSSRASEASTSDLNDPDIKSSGNASQTPTDARSSRETSQESLSGTTSEPSLTPWETQRRRIHDSTGIAPTLSSEEGRGQGVPLVSISSAEDSPARTCLSPADEQDSTVPDPASSSSSHESPGLFDPPGFSSKMFPDSFPATVAEISPSFSRRWPSSGIHTPGGSWTLDTSESPKDVVECSLSDILEPSVPRRFYLSSRAAQGILRRAEKRGRTLPAALSRALLAVAGASPETTSTGGGDTSLSGMGNGGPDDNDAQAGRLVTTHALTSAGHDASEDGTGPRDAHCPGARRDAVQGWQPERNAPGRRHEDDDNIIAFHMLQDPISEEGGGTPAMSRGNKQGTASIAIAYNPHRTLQKDGSILEGFKPDEIIDALHQPTGNKEPLIAEAEVRRLTPTECCRLQGFPDDWFGTPNEAPDSPRYAALGDAVTVNVAEWIGRRLMAVHVQPTGATSTDAPEGSA